MYITLSSSWIFVENYIVDISISCQYGFAMACYPQEMKQTR